MNMLAMRKFVKKLLRAFELNFEEEPYTDQGYIFLLKDNGYGAIAVVLINETGQLQFDVFSETEKQTPRAGFLMDALMFYAERMRRRQKNADSKNQ